jgi:hypothetical protein
MHTLGLCIHSPNIQICHHIFLLPIRAPFTASFSLYNETNFYVDVIYFLKYVIVYSILIISLCVFQETSISCFFWNEGLN